MVQSHMLYFTDNNNHVEIYVKLYTWHIYIMFGLPPLGCAAPIFMFALYGLHGSISENLHLMERTAYLWLHLYSLRILYAR